MVNRRQLEAKGEAMTQAEAKIQILAEWRTWIVDFQVSVFASRV
jgi:hypothetical protein